MYEKTPWKVEVMMKFKWRLKRRKQTMNNKIEVIGIDHGWSNIKTSSQVFVTGVKEITTEPHYLMEFLSITVSTTRSVAIDRK